MIFMTQQTIWHWSADDDKQSRGALAFFDSPHRISEHIRDQARTFHQRLEDRIGPVDLTITNNRRRMVTARQDEDIYQLRLHHMFLEASDEVFEAVVRFVRGDQQVEGQIQNYVQQNRDAIDFAPETEKLETRGKFFDLESRLDAVKKELSEEPLDEILITWGRDRRGDKSIQLGSFDFDQKLIRIHPALDRRWVPEYFVDYVIYHELIHALVPPEEGEGTDKRNVHSERFRRLERQFSRLEEARSWESKNLQRLLE